MNVILETPRLLLRPWTQADAADLYEYARDPAVGPIAGWPPHTDVEDSRRVIRDLLTAPETYAMTLRESGQPIGSLGLMDAGRGSAAMAEGQMELGYWIGQPFWGQGLTGEACAALIRRGFVDLGLTAIWCGYYEGNAQSRRVQDKLGFVYHHTETGRQSPQLPTPRTEHFTLLTRERWLEKWKVES